MKSLGDVSGKIIIDCTNPLGMGPDGLTLVLGPYDVGRRASGGLGADRCSVQDPQPDRRRQYGQDRADPGLTDYVVAGDDDTHKPVVMSLIAQVGFEPIDAGPQRITRLLEAYGMLWIDQALNRGRGRNFAFAITKRSDC